MKFVLFVAALVCSLFYFSRADNQNQETCEGLVQPSAHIAAENKGETMYPRNKEVIKDWAPDSPKSHLLGGMTYKDGCLTVPQPGRYYIYAKIYFLNPGRVHVLVNDQIVNFAQQPEENKDTVQMGALIILKAGDLICLNVSRWPTDGSGSTKILMKENFTYFGLFFVI